MDERSMHCSLKDPCHLVSERENTEKIAPDFYWRASDLWRLDSSGNNKHYPGAFKRYIV